MEEEKKARWEGKVTTTLAKARADQIWSFFNDFFNVHKWFPRGRHSVCYGLHGVNGEVGCIRFCSAAAATGSEDDDDEKVNWTKEKLIHIDHVDRSITYEIIDSNMGLKSFLGTVKIYPSKGDEDDGCVIERWFATEPIQGLRLEDMVSMFQVWLDLVAMNMEEDALSISLKPSGGSVLD